MLKQLFILTIIIISIQTINLIRLNLVTQKIDVTNSSSLKTGLTILKNKYSETGVTITALKQNNINVFHVVTYGYIFNVSLKKSQNTLSKLSFFLDTPNSAYITSYKFSYDDLSKLYVYSYNNQRIINKLSPNSLRSYDEVEIDRIYSATSKPILLKTIIYKILNT